MSRADEIRGSGYALTKFTRIGFSSIFYDYEICCYKYV